MERDQSIFRQKLQEEMEKQGFDALLLTRAENIFYATGYCSRYAYDGQAGNTIAILPRHGNPYIICSQFEVMAVEKETSGVRTAVFDTWMYIEDFLDKGEKPTQPDHNVAFRMAVDALCQNEQTIKKLGVDKVFLPYERAAFLIDTFGRGCLRDCSAVFAAARAIKTPWEIEVLRQNAKLSEAQFKETMPKIHVGMTEEEIMQLFVIAGHKQSPDVLGIRQAHSVGSYYAPIYVPRKHPLQNGDVVRLDGGVVRLGYISDIARTIAVGDGVSKKKQEIFDLMLETLDLGFSMIGPDVKCADVYKAMLAKIQAKIPEFIRGHFGHSTGCIRGEEAPFISLSNPGTFQPGMVFCMETPYYSSTNGSYAMEDTFLITDNGYERFAYTNRSIWGY